MGHGARGTSEPSQGCAHTVAPWSLRQCLTHGCLAGLYRGKAVEGLARDDLAVDRHHEAPTAAANELRRHTQRLEEVCSHPGRTLVVASRDAVFDGYVVGPHSHLLHGW